MAYFQQIYELLSVIELFGKTPELYYKRKQKKSSTIGIILTIIYIFVCIIYSIFRLIRMLKRTDVTFYDSYAYKEFPSLHLTNEEFYGGFAMGGIIDETIYYPKVQYVTGKKISDKWNWNSIDLEYEICNLEKFGSKYKEKFKSTNLNNLYCLKDVNFDLYGYNNLNAFSYIFLEIYPCINKTKDGISCKPKAYLEEFFRKNIIEFKMQDIDLSPEIYKSPVEYTIKDINGLVFKDLYQQIYSYIQIVILKTEEDITGISYLSKDKIEKFGKYEDTFIVASPSYHDIIEKGTPVCDVTLQLDAKVLTLNRSYSKLFDVLGEIGGFMSFMNRFLNFISFFIIDILYDESLINDLLFFDIKNESILLEKGKTINFNNPPKKKVKIKKTIQNRNDLNQYKNQQTANEIFIEENKNKIKNLKSKENKQNEKKRVIANDIIKNNILQNDMIISDGNESGGNFTNDKQKNNNNINVYEGHLKYKKYKNQIKIEPKFYFCYKCIKKSKNINKALFEEGKRMIREKLDIINLFKKIYENDLLLGKLEIPKEFLEKLKSLPKI